MADAEKKRGHSKNLSVFLYIADVLPQACKSEHILRYIFDAKGHSRPWHALQTFHANFILDGWNDHIIQPARDAVLNYYKVCAPYLIDEVLVLTALQSNSIHSLNQHYAEPLDLEVYMRLNNLS